MHTVSEASPRWARYTTSWRTLGERVRRRLRAATATTPDRFRLARALAVLGLVLAGTVVTVAVETTAQATHDIAERIEPISAGATTLYRSLAAADAALTSEFLAGGPESPQVRQRFDDNVATAARSLAATGAQAGGDIATTDRVGDIAALLPMYTGLAEQARANNQLGRPEGAPYLEHASDLMRSAMLPTAEAVQVRQATQLDETYESAAAVPVTAIVLGLVLLAGLGGVQWYLFRRTRRVFNLGALVATGAILLGGLWWAVAGAAAGGHLEQSRTHVQSVTDALGRAQIAADQARAAESLALVARDAGSEDDYRARIQLLARADGAGGALGAARALASDATGAANVETGLNAARDYVAAHHIVRQHAEAGRYDQAVQSAVGSEATSSASRFATLDGALATAVEYERRSFDEQIQQARSWRTGLTVGIALLAIAAGIAVSRGINQRLDEYR